MTELQDLTPARSSRGRAVFGILFGNFVGIILACGLPAVALAEDRAADDAADAEHWSFRAPQRAAVPVVQHQELVETPVDAFILQKLEEKGIEPVARADRRTLIRRATYDLLGLPPTPDEVDQFVADDSADAYARLIDRLLASPHYGERWGRHWLDVARYANTQGDTGTDDNRSPFAWTYRDYVVRAFNADLPYNQFLLEQIAADRLGLPETSPALAGLGFMTVGRQFRGNIHDTIDDRIDVVTRGTMSLTVSCARCHHHKYDPIPTEDYYSLYGVFASSTEPGTLPVISTTDAGEAANYQATCQKLETQRSELVQQHEAQVRQQYHQQTAGFLLFSRRIRDGQEKDQEDGDVSRKMRRFGGRRWRQALEKVNKETDPVFAPWFAFVAIPEAEFAARATDLAQQIASGSWPHPLNRLVRQAFEGPAPTSLSDVANRYESLVIAMTAPPTGPATSAATLGSSTESAATDTATVATVATVPDPDRVALQMALVGPDAPGSIPGDALQQFFPQPIQAQIQQIAAELSRLGTEHPGAPHRAMVLFDKAQAETPKVFVRGNPNNPGAEVPRQFLKVLSGPERQPFTEGSGRLELARAIISPTNPLTARVLVNRVWLHHFGEGLVDTPDDFGLRSDEPSHPELLDYLALRFMEDGWSIKNLHRLLMLSHTYQRVCDDGLKTETSDPENRLLSRMNRRRLDFESMRDSLLCVAGNLDHAIGGRTAPLVPAPKVSAAGIFYGGPGTDPPTQRRAIYGFIDRQNLPGLLRAFDFADPDTLCGRRYVTTVPQQALFFFNNPFVMDQARSLVARPRFMGLENDQARVHELYRQIYQRPATSHETELAIQFLAEPAQPLPGAMTDATLANWELLAHVLLMGDEFMFID